MLVKNVGHDGLILLDYNGKRYAFTKNVPVDISPEVYNEIILSGHVSAQDIVPCEEPKEEPKKETIVEKVKQAVKPKGKKKK